MKKGTIIVGDQGVRKTRFATNIAKGNFVITNYRQFLKEHFGVAVVLKGNPDAVIVDDMPDSVEAWVEAKELVTSNNLLVSRKYKNPELVDISKIHFIFCAESIDEIPFELEGRRFEVVNL